MNKKTIGLMLMLLTSAFFVVGSYWYMDLAHLIKDWGPRLEFGLRIGIPATLVFILAWRFPRFGAPVAVLLAALAFLLWLMMALLGDMEERLIWSLVVTTAVYLTGAMMVFTATKN